MPPQLLSHATINSLTVQQHLNHAIQPVVRRRVDRRHPVVVLHPRVRALRQQIRQSLGSIAPGRAEQRRLSVLIGHVQFGDAHSPAEEADCGEVAAAGGDVQGGAAFLVDAEGQVPGVNNINLTFYRVSLYVLVYRYMKEISSNLYLHVQ